LESEKDLDFKRRLKEVLTKRPIVYVKDDKRKPSAVLVPISIEDGFHQILFTKRTTLVRFHKGEISFPGGGFHKEDGNLQITALRETWEEIGLEPKEIEILGELDDSITKYSQYTIAPFVGVIPSVYTLKTSEFEIAEIIQIPVAELLVEGKRKDDTTMLDGQTLDIYEYAYKNHLITGATSRILKQFLDIYQQARKG
jgi:8-oxo-dGTP pyrophosphatase MutT (NUDIX family)